MNRTNKLNKHELPDAIVKIFEGREITVQDYLFLDDPVMLALFSRWKNQADSILTALCSVFLDRKKFRQISILNSTGENVADFEQQLKDTLNRHGGKISDLSKEYFWLKGKIEKKGYTNAKENIWVLKNNGTLVDLLEISGTYRVRSCGLTFAY